jgi:hypothetical protein
MKLAWLLIFLTGPIAVAADAQPDPWSPVRFLVGTWTGEAQGEPGKGSVERSYEFVPGGKFIEEKNTSRYEPRAGQKGEVHLHRSFVSYETFELAEPGKQFQVYSRNHFRRSK